MKKKARRRVSRQLKKIVHGYVKCTSILNQNLGLPTDTSSSLDELKSGISNSEIVNVIEKLDNNIDILEYTDVLDADSDEGDDCSVGSNSEASYSKIENTDKNIDVLEPTDVLDDNSDEDDESSVHLNSEASVKHCSSVENISSDEHDVEDISSTYYDQLDESHLIQGSNQVHLEQNHDEDSDRDAKIPNWILEKARTGKIQSCVIDIITLRQYFPPFQVEDLSLPPSHSISLHILSAIIGLLSRESVRFVRIWTRNGTRLRWLKIEPMYGTASIRFLSCDKILELTEAERKLVLLEVAETTTDLSVIPEHWSLFIVSVVYWLRRLEQPAASEVHLHTVVMCLVGMITVDCKIGMYRHKKTFSRKYKNLLARINEARIREKDVIKEKYKAIISNHEKPIDPKKELSNVLFEDCVLAFETLLPYHHLSEEIKSKPKLFSLTTVHAFSQLQSCLFHLLVLNSILGNPFKDFLISHFFSGTFSYNIFTNLSKRNNINAYVETLFQKTPSLLVLYKSLVHVLEKSLIGVSLEKNIVKSRKKKRNKFQEVNNISLSDKDEEEKDDFFDDNNIFSSLSLKD